MNKQEEIQGTLNYVNNSVSITYNSIFEDAKNMSKEQLLELLNKTFEYSMKRDGQLTTEISKTGDLNLASDFASLTSEYLQSIDEQRKTLKNVQSETYSTENSLPSDIII